MSNLHQLPLTNPVVLIPDDPENDAIDLVNQFASAPIFPDRSITPIGIPLAIDINGLYAVRIRFYGRSGSFLYQLEHIRARHKFAHPHFTTALRVDGRRKAVFKFQYRPIGPLLIKTKIEINVLETIARQTILRPVNRKLELSLNRKQRNLLCRRVSTLLLRI